MEKPRSAVPKGLYRELSPPVYTATGIRSGAKQRKVHLSKDQPTLSDLKLSFLRF